MACIINTLQTFLVQCYASACIINTLKTFGEKKNEPNSSSAAEPNSNKMGADGVDDSYGIWLTFAVGIGDWCELVLVKCVDFIDSLRMNRVLCDFLFLRFVYQIAFS